MFSFAVGFNQLVLNNGEIGLFAAIVMLTVGELQLHEIGWKH